MGRVRGGLEESLEWRGGLRRLAIRRSNVAEDRGGVRRRGKVENLAGKARIEIFIGALGGCGAGRLLRVGVEV